MALSRDFGTPFASEKANNHGGVHILTKVQVL